MLGIRHHGPGSARSVRGRAGPAPAAAVLIEGPADADPLLALAAAPGMAPPVALLAYAPDAPRVSAFWPFAVFSPEWQALAWAAAPRGAGAVLRPARRRACSPCARPATTTTATTARTATASRTQRPLGWQMPFSLDPIAADGGRGGVRRPGALVGRRVESRLDGGQPVPRDRRGDDRTARGRAAAGGAGGHAGRTATLREQRREAHMRQVLRAALRETDGIGRGRLRRLARARADRAAAAGLRGTRRCCAACPSARRRWRGCRGRTRGWRPPPGTARGSPRRAGTTTCSPRRTRR